MRSSRGLRDAFGRFLIEVVEQQPEPPRRVAYASVAVLMLREPRTLILLLLGGGWAAATAATAVSGPPEFRVYWSGMMLLGLAAASLPLLGAWKYARTIRSGVVTPAVVETVSHRPPQITFRSEELRKVVAHGSWRFPDGHAEPFQIADLWALELSPGSVVDLLVDGRSVLVIGPRVGT